MHAKKEKKRHKKNKELRYLSEGCLQMYKEIEA